MKNSINAGMNAIFSIRSSIVLDILKDDTHIGMQ